MSEFVKTWLPFLACALAVIIVVQLVGPIALVASYVTLIAMASAVAAILAVYWCRSWFADPRKHILAWLSGAVICFFVPWTLEEIGWFSWSIAAFRDGTVTPSADFASVFQYRVSPVLKAFAAAGAATLFAVLNAIFRDDEPESWAPRIRGAATLSLLVSVVMMAGAWTLT